MKRPKCQYSYLFCILKVLLLNEPVAPSLAAAQPGSKAEVAVAAGTDPEADAAGTMQDTEE